MESMIANEIRKGMVVRLDQQDYMVLETQHVAPGNWRAMVQLKLRNMKTDGVVQQRVRSTDKIDMAFLDRKGAEYLYEDEQGFWFMYSENYDQFPLDKDLV